MGSKEPICANLETNQIRIYDGQVRAMMLGAGSQQTGEMRKRE